MFRIPLFFWKEFLVTTPEQDHIPLGINYDYKSEIWKFRLNGSIVSTFRESRKDFQSRMRGSVDNGLFWIWVSNVNEGFIKQHLPQTEVKFEKYRGMYLRCLLIDNDRISSISFCDRCSVHYGEYEQDYGSQPVAQSYDGRKLPVVPVMKNFYAGQNIYGSYLAGDTCYYVLDIANGNGTTAVRPHPAEFDHPITKVFVHIAWIDKGTLMTGYLVLHSRNDGLDEGTYEFGTDEKQIVKFGKYLDVEEYKDMPQAHLCSNFPICKNVEDLRNGIQETLNRFDYMYQHR